MNKKTVYFILMILALFLAGFLLGRLSGEPQVHPAEHTAETTVYTCSMHPQIQQPEPGDCPICGMDLIPLENDQDDTEPRTLRMSRRAMALADIQTSAVVQQYAEATIRLVGKLGYDTTRMVSLTARYPARIESLYVNYEGIPVAEGEHLAEIYSPDLLTAQRELLSAHQNNPDSIMAQTARKKLQLWDLLPEQIDAIIAHGTPGSFFELKSPVSGIVARKYVHQGDYLKTGEPLFDVVNLRELWLNLEAYETDLTWLRYGQEVTFTVAAFPGETFTGTISFIQPQIDDRSRTARVRVNVPNADKRLKPGMFARASVTARMGQSNQVIRPDLSGKWISPMHPEVIQNKPGSCTVCGMDLVPAEELGVTMTDQPRPPLLVPASAVLRTGKRAVVYVKQPGEGQPVFTGREITLGSRAGDMFIVQEGLTNGEQVVTTGAFKIDSALQIQAKPSMMSPPPKTEMQPAQSPELDLTGDQAQDLLPPYLELQQALAADQLQNAQAALQSMYEQQQTGPLSALLKTMQSAPALNDIRRPYFETLSDALIRGLQRRTNALTGPVYLMHCPMVYADRGADWLQRDDTLRNPYFGAAMLQCGTIKTNLTALPSNAGSHEH